MGRNSPANTPDDPYAWAPRTITGILEKQEYLGHMVNFKTRKLSYKSKKKLENPPDQWKIFENTHEAIIDEDTFARVQELRKNKRRPTRTSKTNMFSGLARCADCGEKLYYCTSNKFEARQDHFVCSTSRKKGKEVCDTHFIRAVVLEEGTLQHMRLVIQCVADYEDAFRRALDAKWSEEAKKELSAKKRTLQKSENRLAELDRLFKRIYEDMVNGKLSETRFQMLSDDYEQEQEELRIKIEMLENEIQNQENHVESVDTFIWLAKKHLYLEKLTPEVLNDMLKAVYVHTPDKSSGHRVQDVDISYNHIGILPANLLYDVMNGKAAWLLMPLPENNILFYWTAPSSQTFIVKLYNIIKDSEDFNINQFTELMFTKVPSFYGFDDADEVTDFFIYHIEELSDDSIKKLMEIYNNNNQFKNRYRHSNDMEIIKKHLENEHKEVEKNSTNNDN